MKKIQFCTACGTRWDHSVEHCLDCYNPVLKPIKKYKGGIIKKVWKVSVAYLTSLIKPILSLGIARVV